MLQHLCMHLEQRHMAHWAFSANSRLCAASSLTRNRDSDDDLIGDRDDMYDTQIL